MPHTRGFYDQMSYLELAGELANIARDRSDAIGHINDGSIDDGSSETLIYLEAEEMYIDSILSKEFAANAHREEGKGKE